MLRPKTFYYSTPNMREFSRKYETYTITREFFPDKTPNIQIDGIVEINTNTTGMIDIVYFTQYENMEQKKIEEYIIHVLADTRNLNSLTVVDLYDPLATMERVDSNHPGNIATANIDAHFWKTLPIPDGGKKIRRILFDHHTLHNRFYYSGGNTSVIFKSAMSLIAEHLNPIKDAVAFPDEGACKRFGPYFKSLGFKTIICGTVRRGDSRIVTITDSEVSFPTTMNITIIDDLVRSGGTLIACAKALVEIGAENNVDVFVTHAQFPNDSWTKFLTLDTSISMFYTTNTIPRVTEKLERYPKAFTVLDIYPIIKDYI